MTNPIPPPEVRAFPDHEVIVPANTLKKAVVTGRSVSPDSPSPLIGAEMALRALSKDFDTWMQGECERLDQARRRVREEGQREQAVAELFRVALDIKGHAATLGYPTIGHVAHSLCRLLEHTPSPEQITPQLIEQHVDAIRAILREHANRGAAQIAEALADRLRAVTDDFLMEANAHRPEYLKGVVVRPGDPA